MIETIMLAALGFLGATLLWLMALPAIARRADRLARRRAELSFPLSLDEVAAERDHLRGEFAVRQRELERKLEVAAADRLSAMGEAGQRARDIAALKATLDLRDASIASLEGVLDETRDALGVTRATLATEELRHAETRADLATQRQLLGERDREAADLKAQRADLTAELGGRTRDLAAMTQRAEGLDGRLADVSGRLGALEATHEALLEEKERLRLALAESRTIAETRAVAIADLEAAASRGREDLAASREALRIAREETAAALGDVAALSGERDRLTLRLNERDGALAKLQETLKEARAARESVELRLAAARNEVAELKAELKSLRRDKARADAQAGSHDRESGLRLQALEADAARREAHLAAAKAERAALLDEIRTLRRAAEADAARLDAENGALRSEILKVADQILASGGGAPVIAPPRKPARKPPSPRGRAVTRTAAE